MSELVQKITAAYEADRDRHRGAVASADELPGSYAAITAEWLTSILCGSHPGAAVSGFRLESPDTGSSNRCKISVQYNEAGRAARLPTALFCKASQELANRIVLGISGGARCEVVFYNDIRPYLEIEAPHSFFARFDPTTFNSIVVLSDLSVVATEFCSHKTVVTRRRAESQLLLLAQMHGQSYANSTIRSRLNALPTWPEYFRSTYAFGIQEGSNQGFLAAEEVIPPRLYRQFENVWPAAVTSVEKHESLPSMLAHGDVHLKNWYVAQSGEMGLSDWQCATRGHWGRDVAYTLATALTVEDRRAWERELLRFYIDRLRAAGGPVVGWEEAWNHYRQQLMSALTWWTITLRPTADLPDMQPRDITLEFIRRIATAMDDLDTIGSLQ